MIFWSQRIVLNNIHFENRRLSGIEADFRKKSTKDDVHKFKKNKKRDRFFLLNLVFKNFSCNCVSIQIAKNQLQQ